MKNRKTTINTIVMILMILVIIVLISVILNMKNTNIEKQISNKEQLTKTSSTDTEITMASDIASILKAKTSDATATESDIADGKTAYVNGELITGNAIVGNSVQAVQYGSQYANLNTTSFSLTGIPNYDKLTLWKNLFIRTSIVQGRNGGLSEVQSYVNIPYNASSGTLSVANSNTGCFVYFYVYYIPQA